MWAEHREVSDRNSLQLADTLHALLHYTVIPTPGAGLTVKRPLKRWEMQRNVLPAGLNVQQAYERSVDKQL